MRNLFSAFSFEIGALTAILLLTGCQSGSTVKSNPQTASSAPAATPHPEATAPTPPQAAAAPADAPAQPVSAATSAAEKSVVRIKAGLFQPFTDSAGNVWLPDQGFEGGDTVGRDESLAIGNTKDPELYRTEHYSMTSFSHKLPNGKYIAKLHFAETFEGITGPGQRVFSFNVHGREFKDVDLWVKAGGPNRAYIEMVPVDVTDGMFKIEFIPKVENPEINAIEIIPQT